MGLIQRNLSIAFAVLALVVGALCLTAPTLQRAVFYPKPRGLPPVVGQATEALLARLQVVLETNAPLVAQSFQPGLSEAQICALESEGGVRLSPDLRVLYRWHNGMATNRAVGLLPGQRFLPLDEAVRKRTLGRQQLTQAKFVQRVASSIFVRHRTGWLQLLDDGAGDGYFYDPGRADTEGAVFYHFGEAGYYVWFPSLRNLLAGIIECYEMGAIKPNADRGDLEEDVVRTARVWERLGRASEHGG